jgi:hypothetical protein
MGPRAERQTWILVAAAIAWMVWSASATWDSVVDDAWISARYAAQVAAGNGVTFNATGAPVEGVTNLAWTFLLAALFAVGAPPHAAMVWLGVLFCAASIGLTTLITQALTGRRDAVTALPAWLLALLPHTAVVATNGLETTMMAAAVLLTVYLWLTAEGSRRWGAGAAAAALLWVRPEGLPVVALLLGADAAIRRSPAALVPLAAPVALSQAVQTGWRVQRFGMWLPNTWAAKADFPLTDTFSQNAAYFTPEATVLGAALMMFVAAAAAPPWNLKKLTVVGIAGLLAFVPLTVNEWMPGLRLFHPAFAVTAALIGVTVASLRGRTASLAAAPVLVGAALLAWSSDERAQAYDARHTVQPHNGAEIAGRHLAAHLPKGAVLATRDAGVLAYFVGVDVDVAELHQRALTRHHPDGKDAAILSYTPRNPEVVATTVRTPDQTDLEYPNDRRVFERLSEPYVYLGRVNQHYRRHYDIYVRADLNVPPLPGTVVVSRAGPPPPTAAAEPAPAEADQ